MLHLVSGRAGSGKSRYLLSKIEQAAAAGNQTFLLVPEQFSHESERDIALLLGNRVASMVEVLSFQRLADYTFARCGSDKLPSLDDGGRNCMMAKAIAAAGEDCRVYRRAALRPELTVKFLSLITELKAYCITPDSLGAAMGEITDRAFRDQLFDIHLIYSIYEGLLRDSFADPADQLTRLAMVLENDSIFRGSHFFLDAFKGFTPQEYGVLSLLFERCGELWVGLCCGGDAQEDRTVFKTTQQTKRILIKLAAKRMVQAEEVTLPPQTMYAPQIAHLERNLFSLRGEPFLGGGDAIRLFAAPDVFLQGDYIARQILHLMVTQGYDYSDFVIITRDMQQYGDVLEAAMEKHGIPVYMDKKSALLSKPVIALLISAMDILNNHFLYEDVFAYLRTYLTDLPMEDIDLFEAYADVLDLKRGAMLRPFTYVPGQIAKAFGETEELLLRLNAIRERFTAPLLALLEQDGRTVEEMTKGIYKFLLDLGVPKNIEARGEELEAMGATEEAIEYGQLWELLMKALDQMVLVSGKERMGFDRYTKLLRMILEQYDIGSIPAVLNRVTMGSAERMRVNGAKCAFLVGFNEGAFPKSDFEQGLISDSRKKKLEQAGLFLSASGQERMFEELFFVYCGVTAGSERLFITWQEQEQAGQRPSYLLGRIRAVFPHIQEDTQAFLEDPAYFYAKDAAFETMLALPQSHPMKATLQAYFAALPDYQSHMEEIALANETASSLHFEQPKLAKALYGKDLVLSPTRIELYQNCRFAHFMKYGLGAAPRRRLAFDALETGTFIHYVLERFAALCEGDFLEEEQAQVRDEAVSRIVGDYVSEVLKAHHESARFTYLFRRLKSTVTYICAFLVKEFRESKFRPIDFELSISDRDGVSPLLLECEDCTIKVVGKVDRVDGYERDGKLHVRVVDYKTGSKAFRLGDVYNGVNLQMLLYLFTLGENGRRYYGKDVERAGILYMPANYEAVPAKRTETEAEILKKHEKDLAMNGLVLDDMEILRAMEPDLAGRFIPVAVKADGTLSASSNLATQRQFDLLKKHTEHILLSMGREMLRGDVRPLPIKACGMDSCAYCDFSPACRYDRETGGARPFDVLGQDELWEKLEKEERGHVDSGTTAGD